MAVLKLLLEDPEIERIGSSEESLNPPDKKKIKVLPSSSTGDANTSRRLTRSSKKKMSHEDDDENVDLPPPIESTTGNEERVGIPLPFFKLRQKPHYVDKTDLIADLHNEEAKGLYLCYPRQAGKSTVLDSFIQWSLHKPKTRESRLSLFEKTKIMALSNKMMREDTSSTTAKDENASTSASAKEHNTSSTTATHQDASAKEQDTSSSVPLKDGIYGFNQHMILFADFGCIQAKTMDDLKRGVIEEFLKSLQTLYSIELSSTVVQEFLGKDPKDIFFFTDLLRLVKQNNFAAETAIVVIDNFDGPVLRELNRTRSTHDAKAMMSFFNQMFHIVEIQPSSEPCGIIKIILTGSHYPIGMRAAHLARFRVDRYPYSKHGYCKKFFFDEEEVNMLIIRLQKTVTLEQLADLFGNYFIHGKHYYHPGCVVNYFQQGENDSCSMYWCTTDSLDILTTSSGIEKYEMTLWKLKPNESITFDHHEVVNFEKIMSDRSHALSYLLQAGYLTEVQPRTSPVSYKVPNTEVRNIFAWRYNHWTKIPEFLPNPFRHFTLKNPDYRSFFDEANEILKIKWTNYDFNYEEGYHVYLGSFFHAVSTWHFQSNLPVGYGRYDFVAWDRSETVNVGYLFEIAHIKGAATDDSLNKRNIQNMIDRKKKQVLKNEYYIGIPKSVKICVIVVGWRKKMYYSIFSVEGA